MKKILLLFFLSISIVANAQNWKTVSNTDTNYYTVQSPIDTEWNNYLRVIWVDSSKQVGTDSVFYFYPSVRKFNDTNYCLDTLGPTWLGKTFIRNTLGEETYFNRDYDSIHINTLATLNTSWIMCKRNGRNYTATITTVDTFTIDNVLDSIKTLTITVDSNGSSIADYYNNKKITFSKNNGFIDALEFYCFPFYQQPFIQLYYIDIFPPINLTHKKVKKQLVHSMNNGVNLQWKYQPGNEFIFIANRIVMAGVKQIMCEHDSIATSFFIGDTAYVTSNRQTRVNHYLTSNNGDVLLSTVYTDTIATETIIKKKKNYLPEYKDTILSHYNYYYGNFEQYVFLNTFCNTKAFVKEKYPILYCGIYTDTSNCSISEVGLCYPLMGYRENYVELGFTNAFDQQSNGVGQTVNGNNNRLVYHNVQPCPIGTKSGYLPMLNQDQKLPENAISIFPNPSNGVIKVVSINDVKIQSVNLFDVQGRKINCTMNAKNEIDMQTAAKGIYMLYISTNKGTMIKKISRY